MSKYCAIAIKSDKPFFNPFIYYKLASATKIGIFDDFCGLFLLLCVGF